MCTRYAFIPKLSHAGRGFLLQLINWPEADRLRRAGLGTRRRQAMLQPVVAERAFLSDTAVLAHVDHAERTRGDAIAATVAGRRIDEHRVELRSQNRAGRADFEAGRIDAVLADVGHHQPRCLSAIGVSAELLDELDVPPVHIREA